ncbi:hypothetical protein CRYUN_Cryun03dG0142000 [Craigia yunnanensis]
MPERTLISWTILMSGYARHGPTKEALALFKEMLSGDKKVRPDPFVYAVVLRSCGEMKELGFGKGVHGQVLKKGEAFDGFLENSLVNMYSSCGLLEDAILIFDGIEKPGLVAWSSMLSAYVKHGLEKEVSSLHDNDYGRQVHGHIVRTGLVSNNYAMCSLLEMYIECIEHESSDHREKLPLTLYVGLERGESNGFIIASMLKWCSVLSNLDAGKLFHSLAKKFAVDSDPSVISALIDMYSKCGMPEVALRVFERVEDPGIATWSALIYGLSWNGWFVEALTCFQKMQFNGIEANEFTFTSVILTSMALGDLRKGRELHCKILKTCYESTVSVVNVLINLYSELSDHQQALKLCSLISDAEISWNLLIQACLKENDYEMIHKLLRSIQSCSGYIEPISVCDIFSSCTSPVLLHMGVQAQAYMTKMGLLSHPTSGNGLIQMYSGCGQIAEADLAFELMPEKSSLSWTSIISAKVEHGHPSEALALFNDMRKRNKLVDSSTLISILKACGQWVGWMRHIAY